MNQANNSVFDLSDPEIWSKEYFHSMVLQGLRREGFTLSSVDAFAQVLKVGSCRNLDETLVEFLKVAPDKDEAEKIAIHLSAVVKDNMTCYLRDTDEKNRVISWPNNQRAKRTDPSKYVDIYEDYFYRDTHRFINKQTPIGSAGSCFASRISHQLQLWGYNYIIEEDDLPADISPRDVASTIYRSASARYGNLFNVPSMRQMVERAFGLHEPETIIARDGKRIIDPFRAITALYKTEEGYLEDYRKHNEGLRKALSKCEVFILTLGLTEAWQFVHSGQYVSVAPWKVEPVLLRKKNLNVKENVEELEKLFEIYRRFVPGIKLIISVSPVPLNKTFCNDRHVVEASSYSKSTLRAAAEEFVRNHPESCFYFPSYEMVMYGTRKAWEPDMRHVSWDAVRRVMRLFQIMYLEDQQPYPIKTDEKGFVFWIRNLLGKS
ncbi:MAG: GSCFA domain-containing protein [Verrucomicrobiota bacterium]|nr:GSCFA domain-containing protein [Verrucomicrobiota bacterium]